MEDSNPELESFRKQWQEEVTSRRANIPQTVPVPNIQFAGPSTLPQRPPRTKHTRENPKTAEEDNTVEHQSLHFDGPSGAAEGVEDDEIDPYGKKSGNREPKSALEHYEKAVEKETQGSLGDSLDLYRKAFRVSLISIEQTTKLLLTIISLMIKLIENIRTNITHPLPFLRNLQIQIHPMHLPLYLIPHTTH